MLTRIHAKCKRACFLRETIKATARTRGSSSPGNRIDFKWAYTVDRLNGKPVWRNETEWNSASRLEFADHRRPDRDISKDKRILSLVLGETGPIVDSWWCPVAADGSWSARTRQGDQPRAAATTIGRTYRDRVRIRDQLVLRRRRLPTSPSITRLLLPSDSAAQIRSSWNWWSWRTSWRTPCTWKPEKVSLACAVIYLYVLARCSLDLFIYLLLSEEKRLNGLFMILCFPGKKINLLYDEFLKFSKLLLSYIFS